MTFVDATIDAYIAALIAVLVPTAYYLLQRHQQPSRDAPYRPYLNLFLLLHSTYIIYVLFLRRPPNILRQLHIPLSSSPEVMRALVLQRVGLDGNATLPKSLETLLTRLSAFEMRTLYVRFLLIFFTILQDCEYCKTFDEYALFALPSTLLDYVREVAVLGIFTIAGSGRERWRTYVVGALVTAAIAEAYWIATAVIQIPRDGGSAFMWHDNLWALRQVIFLSLSIVTHLLPATPIQADPAMQLLATHTALERTMTRIANLRFTKGAIMRDPTLRAAAGDWWDKQRVEGQWAREDESVQRAAERLGRGFAEAGADGRRDGRLRSFAKEAVARLKAGYAVSASTQI